MKLNKGIILVLLAGVSSSGILQAVSGKYYNMRIQSVEDMLNGKTAMDYIATKKNLDELRIALKNEKTNSDRYKRFQTADKRFNALIPAASTQATLGVQGTSGMGRQVSPARAPGWQAVSVISDAEKNEALAAAQIADESDYRDQGQGIPRLPAPEAQSPSRLVAPRQQLPAAPFNVSQPTADDGSSAPYQVVVVHQAQPNANAQPPAQSISIPMPAPSPLSPEPEIATPSINNQNKHAAEQDVSPKNAQENSHEIPEMPGAQGATPSVILPPKVTPIIASGNSGGASAQTPNAPADKKTEQENKIIFDLQQSIAQLDALYKIDPSSFSDQAKKAHRTNIHQALVQAFKVLEASKMLSSSVDDLRVATGKVLSPNDPDDEPNVDKELKDILRVIDMTITDLQTRLKIYQR